VQREAAERAFEVDGVADLHLLEDVGGVAAAGYSPHVQFDHVAGGGWRLAGVGRRAGKGEGAPGAVFEHDVDVLPGHEGQLLIAGQRDEDAHQVG
jgi:hypothetical protein